MAQPRPQPRGPERPMILLADDEHAIREALGQFLHRAGFDVLEASTGERALELAQTRVVDLCVLDVLMPGLDGREVLRRLRRAGSFTPVLLLTQVGDAGERAMALEEGADDYLNKPFDPHELVARVRAVLRRARPGERSLAGARRLLAGALVLDRRAHLVQLNGQEVALSPRATALLEYLMLRHGEFVSRRALLDDVWGAEGVVYERAVDVRISELRRLLGDEAGAPRYLETRHGVGYRFLPGVQGVG